MTTKLDKILKREIAIKGSPYIITLSPESVKLTAKGKRKGQELTWDALLNGEAAVAGGSSAAQESDDAESDGGDN